MRRLCLVLGLTIGLVPVMAGRALACSCAPASPTEYARAADVVFTGKATATSKTMAVATTVFAVDTVYKGSAERLRIVETSGFSGSCGYEFVEGQRYTVFTFLDHSGRWQTTSCSGNVSNGIAAAKYKLAATPLPRESVAPLPVANTDRPHWPWLILAVGLMVVFAFGFLAGRQRPWSASSGRMVQ